MQTSGIFKTHSHTVNFKSYGKPIRLVVFGDVHRDSPNHADGAWQDFLTYARGLKDAIFLGMGDYLDATSASEREMLGNIAPKMHETFKTDIPKLVNAKVEMMAKELAFMKGRLVGLINGNHFYQFGSDINSDQKLCDILECRYLGVCSFIRLYLHGQNRHHAIDLFVHHGKGAARLVGGSINRVAQMVEGAEADVFIMGHDHKRGAMPMSPRLFLTHSSKKGLEVRHKEVWAVRSGSFLASYRDGEANYNVDAARGPCSLGHVELLITPKRDGEIKIQSLV